MFKKENLRLVAAVSAPILLIGFFLLRFSLSSVDVADPQYDVLLSKISHRENSLNDIARYVLKKKNKGVELIAHKATDKYAPTWGEKISLFRFDVKTQKLIEIPFDPTLVKRKINLNSWVVDIPELATYEVSISEISPDGYRYGGPFRSLSSPLGLLSTPPRAFLEKEGRHVPIIGAGYSFHFQGWVLKR